MKRIASLIAIVLFTFTALAQNQQPAPEEFNSVREYKNRIFTVQNGDVREIAGAIKLLGSGFKGAGLSVNTELRTITVRDFPENLAAIEEAIKRLDHAEPKTADIELKISVLIAAKTPLPNATLPDELAPVVKQLQSTLRYTNYGLMTSMMHRTKIGDGIRGSGVAEPMLLGMSTSADRPIFYNYELRRITSDQSTVDIENFDFSMNVPVDIGGSIQYQPVGFKTPVSIRQGEKVVIGTTTMRDKALVVVVTASVN